MPSRISVNQCGLDAPDGTFLEERLATLGATEAT